MSQTKEDSLEDSNLKENIPNTNTPISKKPKSKLEIGKQIIRNQTIHKRRKERNLNKMKSQVRQEKIKKIYDLNHESKRCCLLSPKRTYKAIYDAINYPKTAILPNNGKEWENLKDIEEMHDVDGLTNYITNLHKQMTSVYFMVRDLEYRYHGYHI